MFFTETVTTDIYTYVHTLSLHSALPIFGADDARRGGAQFGQDEQKGFAEREGGVGLDQKARSRQIPDDDRRLARRRARRDVEPQGAPPHPPAVGGFDGFRDMGQQRSHHRLLWRTARSEEHTSELQSLMRISYAVFCLKKTNN